GLPNFRSLLCPPSPLKVMPMVHHTRTPPPMPRNSRANTSTASSRAASATIFRRKPRRLSPRQSSKLQLTHDRRHRCDRAAGDPFPVSSSFQIRRERYLSTSPNEHCLCQILVCFFVSPSAFLSLPVTTADSGEQLASAWRPRKAGVRCRAAPPVRLQVQASL